MVFLLDVSAVAGHHAMPAALLSPFQNNPKNLDPSYMMDLDFGGYVGKEPLGLIAD